MVADSGQDEFPALTVGGSVAADAPYCGQALAVSDLVSVEGG